MEGVTENIEIVLGILFILGTVINSFAPRHDPQAENKIRKYNQTSKE